MSSLVRKSTVASSSENADTHAPADSVAPSPASLKIKHHYIWYTLLRAGAVGVKINDIFITGNNDNRDNDDEDHDIA